MTGTTNKGNQGGGRSSTDVRDNSTDAIWFGYVKVESPQRKLAWIRINGCSARPESLVIYINCLRENPLAFSNVENTLVCRLLEFFDEPFVHWKIVLGNKHEMKANNFLVEDLAERPEVYLHRGQMLHGPRPQAPRSRPRNTDKLR